MFCDLHGLTGAHARLFAELGRVDDGASVPLQLLLQPRQPTQAMRERAEREKARDRTDQKWARQQRRFAAVLALFDAGCTKLDEACEKVGESEKPQVGLDAVKKDFNKEWKRWREAGIYDVPFRVSGNTVRPPSPGRPKKENG